MQYLFHGFSLQNKRPSNMDSLLLKCRTLQGKNALLALVCDGVGRMADGAFASGEAARMLGEWFDRTNSVDRIGLCMLDAVLKINSDIISRAKENKLNTATTLSALLLIENAYYTVHIGDSRIYCYNSRCGENQALSLLTNDDISKSGKLTACIGQTEDVFPQYSEGTADNKTFLLCSDGLYKRMDRAVMVSRIKNWSKRTLKESAEDMAQYVIARGEPDNISVALVKIED